jgi:gentisate 1,2-dioxygenase
MKKLDPPLPNPKAIPFLWKYKEPRPNLLRASSLVTEGQAERRVLMLVNPNRGTEISKSLIIRIVTDTGRRTAIYDAFVAPVVEV